MVLAFALAALTLTHTIREWEVIVIAFLVGIVNAFDVPIRQAFFCADGREGGSSQCDCAEFLDFQRRRVVGRRLRDLRSRGSARAGVSS